MPRLNSLVIVTRLLLSIAVFSPFAVLSSLAFSAADNGELETTIVTATRTTQTLSEAYESISVYTRKDIERLQAVDLFELLARTPGATFVRNGGRGSVTSLQLRGNQSDHVLILVDGVRIGSATLGSSNLAAFNLNTVERVEVIRGPKSALYGADAIAGVVNIVTRGYEGRPAVSVKASYGSNSTSDYSVAGQFGGERFSLGLSGNFFDTDGIDHTEDRTGVNGDDDGHRGRSFGVNYRFAPTDAIKLTANYNFNDGHSEYDAGCLDSTIFANVDCLIYTDTSVHALSAMIEAEVSANYRTSLQMAQTRDDSNNLADNVDLSNTFSGGEFNTTKLEATWLNTVRLGSNNVLTVGADYQKDKVDSSTQYDVSSRDNTGAFLQLESKFGAFNVLAGIRYDDNEQFGDATTPSLLLGWNISDQLRAYVSYAEGFKPPTFNDLYFPNFGDPTFIPEESENIELGIKGDYANTSFQIAVFESDIENLIQFNNVTFVTDQTAEATMSGAEFSVATALFGINAVLSGTFLDTENKVNGLELRRIPELSASLDLDYAWQRFNVGLSVRGESSRFDDPGNFTELSGYGLLGVRASYQVNDQWSIEARVDNALDKQYSTATDFSLGRYRAIGREAFLTVRYTPLK